MKRVVAGIDAGKAKPDVHLDGKDRTLPNDRDGFRAIAKWFRDVKVERVVLEATGRMHRALVRSLHAHGFAVSVVYVAARDMLRNGRIGLPRTGTLFLAAT